MDPIPHFDRLFTWLRSLLGGEPSISTIAVVISTFVGFYLFYTFIYGLFLCPTRHIPGPFITQFTSIPYTLQLLGQTNCTDIQSLHEKYGLSLKTQC